MGRKRKSAMEKFKDWAQIKSPEKDFDLVEFSSLLELDSAIYALCIMRLHHPDITKENTGVLSAVLHFTLWEAASEPKKRKVIYPYKYEVDIIKKLSKKGIRSFENTVQIIKEIKD